MMKFFIWLCLFLSIPLIGFAATKQPSSISLMKESGKNFSAIGILLITTALLRFPVKHYLGSNHSKQHSFFRNTSQTIIQYHRFIGIAALLFFIGHGVAFALSTSNWTLRLLLGSFTFLLFLTTSILGYLITKNRLQKTLFRNLHITFILLALSTGLLHVKYKIFASLF